MLKLVRKVRLVAAALAAFIAIKPHIISETPTPLIIDVEKSAGAPDARVINITP